MIGILAPILAAAILLGIILYLLMDLLAEKCPKCGSGDIDYWDYKKYYCHDCGTRI